MNNFVFSQDPILYSSTIPSYQQDPMEIKKQLDVVMAQYQNLQQNQSKPTPEHNKSIDYLGELDTLISELDENETNILNQNAEFVQLNNYINQSIQAEIVNSIKWRINSDQEKIDKIIRLKTIINEVKKEKEIEQKKNMSELNDYIQNYSDMTFNEYKKIKQSKI